MPKGLAGVRLVRYPKGTSRRRIAKCATPKTLKYFSPMCPQKCQKLKYLGESYLEGRLVGKCLSCSTIFHGYRCNWRLKYDQASLQFVLIRRKVRGSKSFTRPQPARPRIDLDLIKELSGEGMTLARAKDLLQKAGLVR